MTQLWLLLAPDLFINRFKHSKYICGLTFEFGAVIEILFNFFDLLQFSFFQSHISSIITWQKKLVPTSLKKIDLIVLTKSKNHRWKCSFSQNRSNPMVFKGHYKNFGQIFLFFDEPDGMGPFFRNFSEIAYYVASLMMLSLLRHFDT